MTEVTGTVYLASDVVCTYTVGITDEWAYVYFHDTDTKYKIPINESERTLCLECINAMSEKKHDIDALWCHFINIMHFLEFMHGRY